MKHNLYLGCAALPILISALVLIGADGPVAETDSTDTDGDGMSDVYERFYWLDYRDARDALLDYDGDHLLNAREAVLGTDPFASDCDGENRVTSGH